jgi:hypothetical protein
MDGISLADRRRYPHLYLLIFCFISCRRSAILAMRASGPRFFIQAEISPFHTFSVCAENSILTEKIVKIALSLVALHTTARLTE